MLLSDLRDIKRNLSRGQRLLGLDVGSKTVGLALSDPSLTVATAMETIRRKKFTVDAVALEALIDEHGIGGLIIGLPVSMDGTEGPACQSIRQFATNLDQRRSIPIAFWDERLSTSAIERFLVDEADMSRDRRAEVVDKMAAAYILQGALDMLKANA